MISLGGLSAVPGAFQDAQKNFYANLASQQQQQGLTAYGQALAALAGGQGNPISTTPQLPTSIVGLNMPRPQATPAVAPLNPLVAALQARGYGSVQPSTQDAPYGGATPSDSYADRWLGKFTNRAGQPGFDPNKVTTYEDPYGEVSIPDSNSAPPGSFSLQNYKEPPGFFPPGSQPSTGGDMASWKNAISQNESGGDYSLLGPKQSNGDYAVGKYQVMASNVGPWTQEILGQAMTPDQFRASPDAQEKVFEGKFGQYVKEKGSPQGAALAWFAGPGGTMSSSPDSLGTTPASYVAQFNAGLGKGGGAGGVRLPDTSGVQPGTLTWASAVNAIKAVNPKISPAALALATDKLVPLMNTQQAQQWKQIDEQRQNFEAETSRISATKAPVSAAATGDVGDIVQAIKEGRMPPPGAVGTSRFYPVAMNAQISRELAKDTTYNTSAHIIDWNAMQRATATQNSPVTTRIVGAIGSARAFLDTFQKNLDTWNAAQLPTIINQQILDKAAAGVLPGVSQKQGALIKSQYGELVTLLASVFQAGGVPTGSATQLAKEQIDLGWSRGTIDAVIDQINNNLDSREAAIRGVQPFTPGSTGPNTYSGGSGQPTPAQAQPAPAASNIPAGGTPVPPNGFTDAGQPPQSYLSQGGTADDWKYVPPEQRKFFP